MGAMTARGRGATRTRTQALAALVLAASLLGMHGVVAVCLHHLSHAAPAASAPVLAAHVAHPGGEAAVLVVPARTSSPVPMDDESSLLALCLAVLAGVVLAFALVRAGAALSSDRVWLVVHRAVDRVVRGPPDRYQLAVLRL